MPTLGDLTLDNGETLCVTYTPKSETLSGDDFFELRFCDNVEPSSDIACTIVRVNLRVLPSSEIKIFEGISPRDLDGKNDTWIIEGIENYPRNRVQLYNESGRLVFEAAGYDNNVQLWDGSSNTGTVLGSNILPAGIYFYVIDFGVPNLPQKTGRVYLR